jgi:glycosyltransferase involved in cell wall biosynthesis
VKDYPRVLFVTSAAFNGITGGGITFSNLFRGWPQDRLFTAHNDVVPVSFDVCRHYYRLGTGEIGRWPHLSGVAGAVEHEGGMEAVTPGAVPRAGALRQIRQLMVGAPWPDSGQLTPQLAHFIEQARPQLIYTILGTLGMTQLVRQIRDRFRLPVAVHFMDDYLATLYRGGFLSSLLRARLNSLTDDVVKKAALRLAIGDDMAKAYGERWRKPFTSIQNAVDVEAITPANPERDIHAPLRLAYIGSILPYAQSQSLMDIAASVSRSAVAGTKVSLDIHSPLHLAEPFRKELEIHPAVRLHDTIRDDASFFRAIREVDALLLPVNFDPASIAYIRYSMPTKVPAYLASGTPILAYGPSQTAQIADAQREGWGLVVDRRDPHLLDQAIGKLATDNGLRRSLSERARAVACRHDVRHVRGQFQGLFAQVAENEANSP